MYIYFLLLLNLIQSVLVFWNGIWMILIFKSIFFFNFFLPFFQLIYIYIYISFSVGQFFVNSQVPLVILFKATQISVTFFFFQFHFFLCYLLSKKDAKIAASFASRPLNHRPTTLRLCYRGPLKRQQIGHLCLTHLVTWFRSNTVTCFASWTIL